MILRWSTPFYAARSLFAVVYNFIRRKPLLVKPEVEQLRLMECRMCDKLIGNQCSVCACYVDIKAAFWHERCPLNPPKWK